MRYLMHDAFVCECLVSSVTRDWSVDWPVHKWTGGSKPRLLMPSNLAMALSMQRQCRLTIANDGYSRTPSCRPANQSKWSVNFNLTLTDAGTLARGRTDEEINYMRPMTSAWLCRAWPTPIRNHANVAMRFGAMQIVQLVYGAKLSLKSK